MRTILFAVLLAATAIGCSAPAPVPPTQKSVPPVVVVTIVPRATPMPTPAPSCVEGRVFAVGGAHGPVCFQCQGGHNVEIVCPSF